MVKKNVTTKKNPSPLLIRLFLTFSLSKKTPSDYAIERKRRRKEKPSDLSSSDSAIQWRFVRPAIAIPCRP